MKNFNHMKKTFLWTALFLLAAWRLNAQEYLFIIGTDTVMPDEFEYMYTKNLDLVQDPQQKDVDYYKDLFVRYKQQLADAKAKGLDKDWNFRAEYSKYRRDLAKKYLKDEEAVDRLVREAYERMQRDLDVSHIMILVPEDALPADTLKAWKKINKIYKKLRRGAGFEQMALQYSEDPSVKENKGHLGWINVFHTVYPFESAAYRTPKGHFSKPFRTRYGYHIVKVNDERPAVYRVQVAQIMLIKGKDPESARKRIRQIYEQLRKEPESFEELARKYSEDKISAKRGGVLPPFGIREKIPAFEDQAMALKHKGDISEPFETPRAWHILKLLRKDPVPPFDKVKAELRRKVMNDERSRLAQDKVMQRIRRTYSVREPVSYRKALKFIDESFFQSRWKLPEDWMKQQDVILVINDDQKVYMKDFLSWLYRHQQRNPQAYKHRKQILDKLYKEFKDEKLKSYYENHLEDLYPDFARTSKEYYDGLLLFNYKSKEIWEKAINDTLGLEKFYKENADRYRQPTRYRVAIVETSDKKTARRIYKALKNGIDPKELYKLAGDKALVRVKVYDEAQAKPYIGKVRKQKKGDKYEISGVLDKIDAHVPPLKEIRGKVLSDYQKYLEQKLMDELQQKYPVRINRNVWNRIRSKYKK